MRHYRFLKIFFTCLLMLTGAFSEKAAADFQNSPILAGIEKMATAPSITLKDPRKDILFEPIPDGVLTLTAFNSSNWFRISMEDLIRELERQSLYPDGEGILMFATSHITHVDCFIPKTASSYTRYSFGRRSGNVLQFLYTRYPVLWLPPLKDFFREGYVYLNVRSDYPVSARLHLLSPIPFIRFFFKSLVTQLTFVGIMIAFAVTYFLFHIMTGEKIYRTFMVIQLGITLLAASFNGHLHSYLKLPTSVSVFVTWGAFGLASITGGCFFLHEFQAHPRIRKLYSPILYIQIVLASVILAAALSDRFFWVFIGISVSLFLSLFGSLLVFALMIRRGSPIRSLILYLSSHTTFFAGIGVMFLSSYYATHYLSNLPYPDLLYMALLLISPLLMILLMLFESRARFDGYNRLQAQSAHYRELSQKDSLTGLYNRSYLKHALEESVRKAEKSGKALSYIMLDIDHFKRFNDTWGHQEGDRALTFVAKIIRESLREQDIAARYGGEEFSVLLCGAGLSIATLVAERIRKSCEDHSSSLGPDKTLTVSLGISLFRSGDTPESLIRRADEALYRAKGNGRNRAEMESQATS